MRFKPGSPAILLLWVAVGCTGTSGTVKQGSGGGSGNGGAASGGTQGSGGATSGGATGSGGSFSTGGSVGSGGSAAGGTTATGGSQNSGGSLGGGGGISASGGSPNSGGATATGGSRATGGAMSNGGGGATGAGGATGGTSAPGSCDPGSSTTIWASGCVTTAPPAAQCVSGTWTDPGSSNNYPLVCESAHFAIHAKAGVVSTAQCNSAFDFLENTLWPMRFGSPMFEPEPFYKSASKSKLSIEVDPSYGDTGGCWGKNQQGIWIPPATLADHWGLAHETTHAWQCGVGTGLTCDTGPNTCGWIFESHANWQAFQVPEYHTTNVHCSEYLANAPHLYLGSTRDRYCNWQFMEYLKDRYCYQAVHDIWLAQPGSDDPFTNIMTARGWSVSQLNDFWGEWAMHNVTWDYQDPSPESTAGQNLGKLFRSNYGVITDTSQNVRRLRLTKVEPLDTDYANDRRFISPFYWAPQRYGYNIIRLYPDAGATSVTVTFRGVTSTPSSPDWRWGMVATDAGMTTARYSTLQRGSDGQLDFCVSSGEALFLVVMATPSAWYEIVWDQAYGTVPRYPYMVQLASAWPDGFQGGKPDACPSGTVRIANGGGCASSGLASTVYVGPYALVTGSSVSGSARIQDHAQVLGGKVADATVGALTLFGSAFSVTGASTKAMTTFFPLDFFEGRNLTGGALVGDVELRADHSSGTCSGFVDSATCTDPGTDNTPAPPYTWRK